MISRIKITLIAAFVGLCFGLIPAAAQNGMQFPELAEKLDAYFPKELINDVHKQLPQSGSYAIWGWDVGDFSGDGVVDCALSLRSSADKGRTVRVYLFVDIDGYLVKVGMFKYDFVETPLEIGPVIKNDICYITHKKEQYNWNISGFQFDNGSIYAYDVFTTERVDDFTKETYVNYKTMETGEKYVDNSANLDLFDLRRLIIPSYSRGRFVYKGYADEVFCNIPDFAVKGAYYWEGDGDLSFTVSSAYDREFIYMTVEVNDSDFVAEECDDCPSDMIEVWFDAASVFVGETYDFFEVDNSEIKYKEFSDSALYCFKISPGDFYEKKAFLKEFSSTEPPDAFQRNALSGFKAVSNIRKGGYIVKFKIPFDAIRFDTRIFDSDDFVGLGCTVAVYDSDNQFRPEEATLMATSNFDPSNLTTFGTMLFVPDSKWYGENFNIYKDKIVEHLAEFGF